MPTSPLVAFVLSVGLGAVAFQHKALTFFTVEDETTYYSAHLASTSYLLLSLLSVWYFYKWREDPINAKPAMFPRVLNTNTEEVKTSETAPLTNTEGKYLVIGAGFVGLGMAGGLQRHELPFDIVEKEEHLGGNWRYGVYDTVHIISSKKTTEFKDFPMPPNYPDFPSCTQMRDYLDSYANHYHLHERLVCGVSVQSCVPVGDGSGGWDVTLTVNPTGTAGKGLSRGVKATGQKEFSRNNSVFAALSAEQTDASSPLRSASSPTSSSITVTRRYKGVIVSLGHHSATRMPTILNSDKFKGKIVHSKQVWSPSQEFCGKRVLVIGGGNSACDLATEAGRFGIHATISSRRGAWIIPRTFMGTPSIELVCHWMPMFLQRLIIRLVCRLTFGSYAKNYGLQEPTIAPLETHPVINNDLLQSIKMGRVSPKPGVKRVVSSTTVEFQDGTTGEYDLIVAATGFKYSIPMLSPDVLTFKDGIPELYGGFVTPNHRHLYVTVGGQVRYGVGPFVTVGAQSLGHAIKVQDTLTHPLGSIFRAVGEKKLEKSPHCSDALVDPAEAWRKSRVSQSFFGYLPLVEKLLIRFGKLSAEPAQPVVSTKQLQSPLRDRSGSPGSLLNSEEKPRWRHSTRGSWKK